MTEQVQQRLKDLEAEYQSGQKILAELDAKRSNLTSTLLRIEGAIQVLREMVPPAQGGAADGASAGGTPRNLAPGPGRAEGQAPPLTP